MNPEERSTDRSLETIGVFASITEASIARARLEEAGIRSWLQGELSTGQLFPVGLALGGISLEVSDADAASARSLLDDVNQATTGADETAWICGTCGTEVESGFELCWKCQAVRPDRSDRQA